MRLIEGKFNGKKIVSGKCNGVYVFNTKYQTFVNFTASRYKYAKNPFSFNNWSNMVIYLELTEEFDYNADNNFITIGNGERKSTFQITNAETQITDRGTIIYKEYLDITTEDYSDGDYFQSGADLIDGAVIPISITFTNSKGEVETYNNYNGKYAQPVYDNTPPIVSLNGDYEIHVSLNGNYNEPGLTIDDNYLPEYATIKENIVYDSLTGRTKTATDIDTSVEGKYSITYNVSDTANNKTNVVRYVYIDNRIDLATGVVYDDSVIGQVTVTVNANKVIKLPTGWKYVDENEKSIYKVYKESANEKLIVYDLIGCSDAIAINVIVKQSAPANIIKVEYRITGKDETTTYYTNKAKSAGNIFISILLDKKLSNIPTFTINDTENHTLVLDGTFVGEQDNGYYYTATVAPSTLTDFADGVINFVISDIIDIDGNIVDNIDAATNSSIIKLDTVAPVMIWNNTTYKSGSTVYDKNYFLFHAEDDSGIAEVKVNNAIRYNDWRGSSQGTYNVVVTDNAGNSATFKGIVDKTAPTVISETRNKIENTVVVTLKISEKIQIPDGWTKGDGNMVITKTFTENFDGTVPLIDLAGNVTNYQLKVEISSGNVPANVIKVEYNIVGKNETKTYYVNKTKSAGSIFISILLDKQLANIPTFTVSDIENHSFDLSGTFAGEKNNGYYYTATQTISSLSSFVDGEITFKISGIVDADGNTIGDISEATNGSKIILDTVAPKVTFTYSNNNGLTLTSEDVTATVTANEQIRDITGWNRKTDNSLTKVFTKNTKGSLTVFDMAGNSTKASYEVKRIDKTPPDITIKTGSSETVGDATNGYSKISFKIHDSSGMVSWQINDGEVTKLKNASWSDINYLVVGQKGVVVGNNILKVTDKIGNVGTKTFKMIGN